MMSLKSTGNWLGEWLVAILFLMIIPVFWLAIALVMSPVLIPVLIISLFCERSKILGVKVLWRKWSYNMIVSQDQSVNTILGGSLDTSVSSRVGYRSELGNGVALKMEPVINLLFKVFAGQENHCRASIERDEVHNKNWGG
jgi:hypothetical protein